MKVNGPSGSGSVASRPARAAEGGFSPGSSGEAESTTSAVRAGPLSSVGSLEALLALQDAETPTERRRRAVRRAGRILDALDELKIAVLDPDGGELGALQRLQGAIRETRGGSEDPRLAGVLEEVELRAAVELAKRETRAAA